MAKDGAKKADMSIAKTFTMALYAGAYIAFGGFLGLAVVSNCPGELQIQQGRERGRRGVAAGVYVSLCRASGSFAHYCRHS